MLSHVAGDDRVAARRLVEGLDHVLGLDLRVLGVVVAERVALPPAVDPRPPLLEPSPLCPYRAVLRGQPPQYVLGVADDRDMRRDVLRDLRRVDVDVDELTARRELRQLA